MNEELQAPNEQSQSENSTASVTDLLEQRWSDPEEQPQEAAPQEDNAAIEGEDAPVEDASAEEPTSEPELADVEFEGKTYKLPPEVRDALMRQADYTRKTQEVAEARKELETHRALFEQAAQFQQAHTKDLQTLTAIDEQIKRYANVDWRAAFAQDPAAAGAAQAELIQLRDARNALANDLVGKQQQFQAQQSEAQRQLEAAAVERTRQHAKSLPGWSSDADVALAQYAAQKQLPDYAIKEAIKNPVLYEILFKAHQFDKLQAAKPAVEKRVAQLPKPVRPGGNEARVTDQEIQTKKVMSRLKTTGSPSAARDALMLRLK